MRNHQIMVTFMIPKNNFHFPLVFSEYPNLGHILVTPCCVIRCRLRSDSLRSRLVTSATGGHCPDSTQWLSSTIQSSQAQPLSSTVKYTRAE